MKKLILIPLLISSCYVSAHSGRTNSEGCHNDKKRNEYHCHNKIKEPIIPSVNNSTSISNTSSTSYNRKDWPHWIDADNDCQDSRAEILIRDSKLPIKFKRNKPCNVSWGEWHDPYTAKVFYKASDIDIDHIVPLAHAYKMGGKYWTREQRREFANDFENLIAVEDNANQSKGAKPPQDWMPENRLFHCEYLKKWNYIKTKYSLGKSKAENSYINNLAKAMNCR
ncbi:HNH endonuclease [Pseudoalteromonas arctica]|uniref:HNH endonuclease n=1 Tax=Pseudoalteromonas arctica TaxID=394751 RepID=A0AAP7CNN1_9GAMM|nr:HNH endonuclease [Pseudoalteromonas arctica]NMP04851.1 HNH endonuclease [Pseudoalteromonas arctica]